MMTMMKTNTYNKLANKLKAQEKINLLFVSPNYDKIYPYSKVEMKYFDKDKFNCDLMFITNSNVEHVIDLFLTSKKYDCIVNLCDGYVGNTNNIPGVNFIQELEKNGIPYTGSDERVFSLAKSDLA